MICLICDLSALLNSDFSPREFSPQSASHHPSLPSVPHTSSYPTTTSAPPPPRSPPHAKTTQSTAASHTAHCENSSCPSAHPYTAAANRSSSVAPQSAHTARPDRCPEPCCCSAARS